MQPPIDITSTPELSKFVSQYPGVKITLTQCSLSGNWDWQANHYGKFANTGKYNGQATQEDAKAACIDHLINRPVIFLSFLEALGYNEETIND